jgi:hypothetical protein
MGFANPLKPWAVFFSVLVAVSLVNYMIASQSGPVKVWADSKKRLRTVFRT